jgi:hypothetical protein
LGAIFFLAVLEWPFFERLSGMQVVRAAPPQAQRPADDRPTQKGYVFVKRQPTRFFWVCSHLLFSLWPLFLRVMMIKEQVIGEPRGMECGSLLPLSGAAGCGSPCESGGKPPHSISRLPPFDGFYRAVNNR